MDPIAACSKYSHSSQHSKSSTLILRSGAPCVVVGFDRRRRRHRHRHHHLLYLGHVPRSPIALQLANATTKPTMQEDEASANAPKPVLDASATGHWLLEILFYHDRTPSILSKREKSMRAHLARTGQVRTARWQLCVHPEQRTGPRMPRNYSGSRTSGLRNYATKISE